MTKRQIKSRVAKIVKSYEAGKITAQEHDALLEALAKVAAEGA